MTPKVLVVSGDGINCEVETARAFERAGFDADIVHVNDMLADDSMLDDYQVLAFPGGFSFGDELGSGQVLAMKLRHSYERPLNKFVSDKKLVLGVCNGFQILVKLGLLPSGKVGRPTVALAPNDHGTFIDRWVKCSSLSESVWTRGIKELWLPIRHGEGRLIHHGDLGDDHKVLRYDEDVNGSMEAIAGLCNKEGTIFGLMPHPEAALDKGLEPWNRGDANGETLPLKIFKNAYTYCQSLGERNE